MSDNARQISNHVLHDFFEGTAGVLVFFFPDNIIFSALIFFNFLSACWIKNLSSFAGIRHRREGQQKTKNTGKVQEVKEGTVTSITAIHSIPSSRLEALHDTKYVLRREQCCGGGPGR